MAAAPYAWYFICDMPPQSTPHLPLELNKNKLPLSSSGFNILPCCQISTKSIQWFVRESVSSRQPVSFFHIYITSKEKRTNKHTAIGKVYLLLRNDDDNKVKINSRSINNNNACFKNNNSHLNSWKRADILDYGFASSICTI